MKIDLKGKKIVSTWELPEFIKAEIIKLGGTFITADSKIKDIDFIIINLDVPSKLALLLQYGDVEYCFIEDIIDIIDLSFYDKLRKPEKEKFYMNYFYSNCKGKFKGFETKIKKQIRDAIADPNQVVNRFWYGRETRSRAEFKANSKLKMGDKLPNKKDSLPFKDKSSIYKSISQAYFISTSIANPKLKIGQFIDADYFIGSDPSKDVVFVDRVVNMPPSTSIFQDASNRHAKNLLEDSDLSDLDINIKDSYFLYNDKFTNSEPVLINIQNNSVLLLNGSDHGALFETSGDSLSLADILPFDNHRTDTEREEQFNRLDKYNFDKVKAKNIERIKKYVDELMLKNADYLFRF